MQTRSLLHRAAALIGFAIALATAAPVAAAPAAQVREPAYWSVAEAWSGFAPCVAAREPWFGERVAPLLTSAGSDALSRLLVRAGAGKPSAAGCADAACAANALFGEKVGPRVLLLGGYGFDATGLTQRPDRPWSVDELDDILAALSDLPADWFPLDRKRLRLLVPSNAAAEAFAGPPPSGGGELVAVAGTGRPGIILAAGWRSLDHDVRRAAFVHELAHEFSRARGGALNLTARWARAMAADAARPRAAGGRSSVSVYADANAEEDFAESVAAYRYMAPLLKRRAPARYALLRELVFGGREYVSAPGCEPGLRVASAVGR
jgi:hypothetical protein